MKRIPTREEALDAAARAYAEGRRIRDSLPIAEAARRAHRAGGPSIEELERRIAAQRGLTWDEPSDAQGSDRDVVPRRDEHRAPDLADLWVTRDSSVPLGATGEHLVLLVHGIANPDSGGCNSHRGV